MKLVNKKNTTTEQKNKRNIKNVHPVQQTTNLRGSETSPNTKHNRNPPKRSTDHEKLNQTQI